MRASFALIATLAGLTGCYTVTFDENADAVYYCSADADCNTGQACTQFACVDNSGPQVKITGPELLQNYAFGTTELTVNYTASSFEVSDSNSVVEGEGKILVSVLGTDLSVSSVLSNGAQLDISSLDPGTYRVAAQATYGDGTPYTNPSASAYTVFYIEDSNAARPQAAIVFPPHGHIHVADEALEIVVAARNFEFVGSDEDCRIEAGCDPWVEGAECLPVDCEISAPTGHAHVYTLSDYPACLSNEIDCNGDYVLSLRPSESVDSNGTTASAQIPADRFTETGTLTFSIGLQYNDHEPYPNSDFIIYDQITIEVVDR